MTDSSASSADLSFSPRAALASAVVGGAVVGAADACHVALAGRLGLGPIGIGALLLLGLVFGGAVGGVGGGLFCAARRFRVSWHAPLIVGASAVAAARVGVTAALGEGIAGFTGGATGALAAALVLAAGATLTLQARRVKRGQGLAVGVVIAGSLGYGLLGAPATPTAHPSTPERPNLLLVTLASARVDRLGAHPIDTAALDRVAAEGVRFDLAVTPSPDTAAAAAALLTGREPWLAPGWGTSLAEVLTEDSLATGAVVGSALLGREGGLDRGFQVYDDDHDWPKGAGRTLPGLVWRWARSASPPAERRADEVVDRAIRHLGARSGRWFLWVHLQDPAAPYDPPIPWDERYYRGSDPRSPTLNSLPPTAVVDPAHGDALVGLTDAAYVEARYEGELASADAALARLLAAVDDGGWGPNTLVVVAGLHGEALRDGPVWFGHEGQLVESVLHVPLAMRLPGRLPAGARVPWPVELVDVGPTVLDLMGEGPDLRDTTGVNLRPTVEGTGVARRFARAVGPGAVRQTAVRVPGGLIVNDPRGLPQAWRIEGERAEGWTPERLLDLLARAVELDGSGAVAPTALDARTAPLLETLSPPVSAAEQLGAGIAQ